MSNINEAKHFKAMLELLFEFERTIDEEHFYHDRLKAVLSDIRHDMPFIQFAFYQETEDKS